MGDENTMYTLLLDDINADTLMNEKKIEIDTGSLDRLHGIRQEDSISWQLGKHHGPQEKSRKMDNPRLEKTSTIVTTTKEVAIFNCGYMVIDPVNDTVTTLPHPRH